MSAPIATDDAVYVIRVDKRNMADRKAFEAQKAALRQRAAVSMQQTRVQQYLAGLRASAKITDRRKDMQASLRRTNS